MMSGVPIVSATRARETVVAILACCLLLASSGCSSETSTPKSAALPATPAAPARATVTGTAAPGAIVALEPKSPREFPVPADARVMDQYGQQFLPPVLVAQVGQRVEFRSSEDVLHNVRVDEAGTKAPVFNVSTPPFGMYAYTFEKPGYYNVSCDVHPAMRANIFVAATPYIAVADASGKFSISNVEPGQYAARAFSGPTPSERSVDVAAPQTALTFETR
jgi:plastocyanin